MHEGDFLVDVSDENVAVAAPDGKRYEVVIADLREVIIETNDSGPWGADVWWVLRDSTNACIIPQGAAAQDALWPVFKRLPGFDYEAVIAAMGCADNKTFVCWRWKS
jgi:hypothetical protein